MARSHVSALSSLILHRLRWLNLPGAMLVALLQRTPVLRVAATAEELVAISPIGTVLRAAATTLASLGAVHALVGATQFIASRNPVTGTVGSAISPDGFTVTGAQTPAGSFRIVSGALPPGLTIPGMNTSNILNASSGTITGTPTTSGNFSILLRAYEFANAQGDSFPATAGFTISFTISGGAAVAPTFTTQPFGQTVNAGGSVTFTVAATGSPAPTFQWRKDGSAINGATNSSFTLSNVQASDAGGYSVIASNAAGNVPSGTATLVVNAVAATPVFTAQPVAQTIASGSTVVFSAAATGATTFLWQRDGAPIAGATGATLVVSGATAANAGAYTVVASNAAGPVTSNAANLTVVATSDPGRLINLSILTPLAAGETMTMGTVLGGAGTVGNKPLLARAAGPSLEPLGVTGFLPDPMMTLVNTSASPSVTIATNNDWSGSAALSNAFAAVGAFAFASSTSKDAAIFRSDLAPGNYTVDVHDAGTGSGTVIAELYDSSGAAFSTTTPRLINVSVLKQLSTGGTLTAGFVIGGSTAKTVLVRAVGPTLGLAPFGIGGVMLDPQLKLFAAGGVQIAANDDWGGDAQIAATGQRVGAFALSAGTSKDAVLLITLPGGGANYTAQVSPVTTGGIVIVEVYEVP
jgi:hypothetical protein